MDTWTTGPRTERVLHEEDDAREHKAHDELNVALVDAIRDRQAQSGCVGVVVRASECVCVCVQARVGIAPTPRK
jgi:hypothetical protein